MGILMFLCIFVSAVLCEKVLRRRQRSESHVVVVHGDRWPPTVTNHNAAFSAKIEDDGILVSLGKELHKYSELQGTFLQVCPPRVRDPSFEIMQKCAKQSVERDP
jgi:hypothetical protein